MIRWASALLCWSALVMPARAAPEQPPAARELRVSERVGADLPSGLEFVSAQGDRTTLADLRARGLPVLLVLAYARCSMLCSWVLQGVAQALPRLEGMRPGRDYLPVVVSIDPRESSAEAAQKQAVLLERLNLEGRPRDLPFLVGPEAQVRALADALGFPYAWDARAEQYAHPAVVFVLTPTLRVSRYLYGVQYPAPLLREALQHAREGGVRPAENPAAEDQALLRCFRFITGQHRYAAQIRSGFRLAGLAILIGLGGAFWALVARGRRRA